jgi:CheY-specific phosphatase CheX
MKIIIVACLFVFLSFSSGLPTSAIVETKPSDLESRQLEQLRIDIFSFLYDNIFQNLFTELVNGAVGTVGNLLTGLISDNPLGIGKRDLTEQQRIDILSFLYDNIFQNFFTEMVNGATSSIGNLLTGLISSNPLGIGKRDLTEQQRIDLLSFLYDNILQNFFTELVNGAVGTVGNLLTGLISDNPLGIGKRDITEEQRAQLRIDIFSFLYDNILQNFFTELVNGAVGTVGNLLTGLISDNPLNIGRK